MTAIALKTSADYEVFEGDIYVATLEKVAVEDKAPDMYHTEPYQQLRWSWLLEIPGRKEYPTYTSWTSLSLHEKSKLPGLLKALGVNVDDSLDIDAVVGRSCRINIEERAGENGQMKNRTVGYLPLKKGGTAPSAPARRPTPTIDDDSDSDVSF